jgi:hypothetical protein
MNVPNDQYICHSKVAKFVLTFSASLVLLPHVLLKVLRPLETLPANLATKRPLFRVRGKVTLQLMLARALSSAHITDVLVLGSSQEDVPSRGNVQVGRVKLGEGRLDVRAQGGAVCGGVTQR